MSRPIRIYSYCMGAAFCLVVGLSLLHGAPSLPTSKLAALLALAIVGEELVVYQRQRSGTAVLSFSAPAHIAAAIVLGPLLAGSIAALGVLLVDGLRQEGRRFLILNASMFGLATWAAGIAYRLASGDHHQLGAATLAALYGLLALIGTRYLITSLVLAGGTVLVTTRSAAFVLSETLWGELESTIGEGSLGVLIAFAFLPGHWIVFVLLVPLLGALYRSKSIFQQLKEETQEVLDAVATVIDERHPTTAEHTERVAAYVRRFVEEIRLAERESDRLVLAARFHDIGKIAVDASTLSKVERLSDEELAAIRRHPRLSARLLSPFHFASEIARYVEYHHERFDGDGYYSIRSEEIPIEAHVLIVADSFDAMTSPRPYRAALTPAEAVAELHDKSGTHFHPLVARAFAAVVSGEPVETALTRGELESLRREFSRCRRLTLPGLRLLPGSRTATVALAVFALLLIALPGVPKWVAASLAAASVVSAVVVFARSTAIAQRRRRALAAIEAGATAGVVVATSGIANWFAWLEPDSEGVSYRMTSGSAKIPPEELAEACGWANRREELVRAQLRSGRRLLVSAAGGANMRLALALDRHASRSVEELCETICASAAAPAFERPALRVVSPSASRGERPLAAVLLVELNTYEDVRRTAGQLLARRVVAEADRCLREVLRDSDQILGFDDDRFAVSLRVRDEQDLEAIRLRVVERLGSIELPRRAAPLVPQIRATLRDDLAEDVELVVLAERLRTQNDVSSSARDAAG